MGTSAKVFIDVDGEIGGVFWTKFDGYPVKFSGLREYALLDELETKVGVAHDLHDESDTPTESLIEQFEEDASWFNMKDGKYSDTDPFVSWYYLIRRDGEIFVSKSGDIWTPAYMTRKSKTDIILEAEK